MIRYFSLFAALTVIALSLPVQRTFAEDEEFVLNGKAEDGEKVYKQFCVTCHGEKGKGDGIGAAALDPKPADLSNPDFINNLSDAHIYKVVKEGGPAVGKSMFMAPWGGILNDQQIRDVAAYVKTLQNLE